MQDHPLEILKWLEEMGDDLALADQPIDRFAESEAARAAPRGQASGTTMSPGAAKPSLRERAASMKPAPQPAARQEATLPDANAVQSARELAEAAHTLEALRTAMQSFTGCNLKLTAKHTVFADGNPKARLMLVGEAPGRDEDLQGLPFVGRSGQLLDRMLAAIGLNRDSVYITNILPWRPPGNRTPTPAETEICRPFIERHIELVKPEILVMLGGASAKALTGGNDGILAMRGRWMKYEREHWSCASIATLHPAYLLRQPAQKKLAWHDLLKIKSRLAGKEAPE